MVYEHWQTLPLLSRNTGYPVSAQDGNLYADDGKPKYIEEVYNYENEKVLSDSQVPVCSQLLRNVVVGLMTVIPRPVSCTAV